jgi:PPOX class probable F420-dependent enzyme
VDAEEARRRFAEGRVGRLATADANGVPHVVPFVFAVAGDTIYWVVDQKPKRSSRLKRLKNIEANPHVDAVVDHVDEDWTGLWWVRASGSARIVEDRNEHIGAVEALRTKYRQYRDQVLEGPVVAIDVDVWSSWEAGRR